MKNGATALSFRLIPLSSPLSSAYNPILTSFLSF
jgi:hypothetical protein